MTLPYFNPSHAKVKKKLTNLAWGGGSIGLPHSDLICCSGCHIFGYISFKYLYAISTTQNGLTMVNTYIKQVMTQPYTRYISTQDDRLTMRDSYFIYKIIKKINNGYVF